MAEEERKLAAIMFTDLVGYTALTQENEKAALALLEEHARLLRPVFSKHGGREVKMIGDSFLVEFSSALSATLCAVEIQRTLYEHNVANPKSKIELRIGIHIGDVVSKGSDVFGDAVNIASRIEPLASPGSICISQQVYDQVWNKVEHPLVGLGKHELKNVQLPMEVYRLVLPWEKEAISGEARRILPLVDRGPEMERLRMVLQKAIQGEGGLIFIAGEAGVGKTRIAEELTALSKEKQVTTLYGRCSRREGKIPYAPWIEQVREFVRSSPPQLLFKVVGNFGADVAKLVPEVTATLGPVSSVSSGSEDQDRLRFIDGISQLAVNISKESPLLLVMDDMNWADAGSLDVLLSTARQVSTRRILLVGIYRDVEVEEDSDLFDFLYEVKREKLGETLTLKGFGPDDTGILMGEILNLRSVDTEFRDLVYNKTAGNPFFIEELVRSLVEQGVLFKTAKGWDRKPISDMEIPSGVRTVIRQRLSNLDEECLGVLSVASVTSCESKEFSFALLKAVTGMDENRLFDTMERILKTRLIRETKYSGRPGFVFTDTRIRDAIYDEMTLLRRGRYHLKTAEAIQDVYKGSLEDAYGVLVYHYMRGNDRAKAAEFASKAAEQASGVYAYDQAINYLKIALEATEDSPDKAARSRILQKLGEASRYAGKQDYAKQLEEAAKLAEEVGENERAARMYRMLGFWVFDDNRENHTIPNEYFEKAKKLLAGKEETEEAAQLFNNMGRFCFITGRLDEAKELTGRALALSEKLGLPEVQAHAYLTLAILAPPAERETKFSNMQKALKIGLEHNYYDVVARAYNNLVTDSENPAVALKYAQDDVAYFQKVGYAPYADWAKFNLASASFGVGDLAQVTVISEEFLARPNPAPMFRREATGDLGEVALFQGRFEDAEKYLLQYEDMVKGSHDFQEFFRLNLDMGILNVERGKPERGKERLEELVALIKEKELDKTVTYVPYTMWGLFYLVEACIKVGDVAGTEAWAKKAEEMAANQKSDAAVGFEAAIKGKVLVSKKKPEEARTHYEKAVGLLRKGIFVFAFAECLRELGDVLLRSGDEAGAKKAFDEAVKIYEGAGAKVYLEKVAAASPKN